MLFKIQLLFLNLLKNQLKDEFDQAHGKACRVDTRPYLCKQLENTSKKSTTGQKNQWPTRQTKHRESFDKYYYKRQQNRSRSRKSSYNQSLDSRYISRSRSRSRNHHDVYRQNLHRDRNYSHQQFKYQNSRSVLGSRYRGKKSNRFYQQRENEA